MEFDFDGRKSRSNKRKHGIDFGEAQALWNDSDRVEIPAKTMDEPRYLVWMIERLDREARRLGVPRQSIIKIWIAERLQKV
jgi:uncharacterized DUF497 family protein